MNVNQMMIWNRIQTIKSMLDEIESMLDEVEIPAWPDDDNNLF